MSLIVAALAMGLFLQGCKKNTGVDAEPHPVNVVPVADMNLITVNPDDAAHFTLAKAEKIQSAEQLTVTGSVMPDVSREIPVISLANGRVVDIKARLDDSVKKGQLLIKVQSPDITNAFNAYLKTETDEQYAQKSLLRAQDLYQHGAISQSALEQAENTEKDAQADLSASEEQLQTLGVDKHHPSSVVNVYAPVSGVIVAQNVTNAAAAGANLSGSPTAFTIADLSVIWVVCDVNESDISKLQLGQAAQVRTSAYPDKVLTGRVSDIGPILDPALRTAKVRIEVSNPGYLRIGMFATVTLTAKTAAPHAVVPAEAVLHLHDRDWVYIPAGGNQYRRVEVRGGQMLDGNRQEILSGIEPGQNVVSKALLLDSAGSQ